MVVRAREAIEGEFEGAELGDRRRTQRLLAVVGELVRDPSLSFPKALSDDAGLEGTYRLLNNPGVLASQILAPHQRATMERCGGLDTVIVAHDTTTFGFEGESTRSGLGPISNGTARQGFFAHVSLAVTTDAERLPLGVLAANTWARSGKKPKMRAEKRSLEPDRESKRWFEQVQEVEERIVPHLRAIHVMDREGDAYETLSQLHAGGLGFVVRSAHDRRLLGAQPLLSNVLESLEHRCEREVPLTRRVGSKMPRGRVIHPPRHTRVARLAFSASEVELERPRYADKSHAESISLNVVHVVELDAPPGEKPVEWTLFTSEPVRTAADILRVVDIYRARWTIEEFFKALKTGCSFEERQLESLHALRNALAIFLPIAWRLLLLRSLSRQDVDAPADLALTPTQLEVLRAVAKRPLEPHATAKQALLAIAALGGHIKNNGPPGWQVLARGYHHLLLLEIGWIAREKCDR
jgi:hypothetical protein